MLAEALSCRVLLLTTESGSAIKVALAGLDVTHIADPNALLLKPYWHDIYVLDSTVSGTETARIYEQIRAIEPNVPIVLVGAGESLLPLEGKLARDPAAYVAFGAGLSPVRQLVEHLIAGVEKRAMDARLLEIRAIVEETAARHRILVGQSADIQQLMTSDHWQELRTKSMNLFFDQGGTASQFERLWPGVRREAIGKMSS